MAWVVKTSEVGEDSKEDTAVALEAYLKRQVSNGHFRQLPFQLLYILCLLACLQDVHTHVKTFFQKADAKNTFHFYTTSIQRHHMESTDLSLLIIYWHQLH